LLPWTLAYIHFRMTSSATLAPTPVNLAGRPTGTRAVRAWLYLVALMIVAMVLVGGATRLTESGLSITEWKPIHGVIPPLNEAEWQEEFAKYQQIPEYQVINKGMTLEAFKGIFWWEWAHRLLGRLIGAVFFVPFLFFLAKGWIEPRLRWPLAGLFVLGGLQGAIGWWMVVSGLTERTDVSQYRLATHLTFACAILAYTVWIARGMGAFRLPSAASGIRRVAELIVGLVILQIFLGGLVAGLNAGMTFNTWPLMDGAIVPSGLYIQEPAWRNVFENVATVQFNHRMVAYLLLAVALLHAWQARGSEHGRFALLLAAAVTAQAGLGIVTLLLVVPIDVALTHQLGAVVVLWLAVTHLRQARGPSTATGTSAAA
jgi:cytochrome c oxidase assembly protein subunit 15